MIKVPSRTWIPGKLGDLNFICPGPEIDWNLPPKVRKPGQSQKYNRKPVMLRYTTYQYYVDTIDSEFCVPMILQCLSHLHFGAKIVCTKIWRMAHFDLDKTWNCMANPNWEPWVMYMLVSDCWGSSRTRETTGRDC